MAKFHIFSSISWGTMSRIRMWRWSFSKPKINQHTFYLKTLSKKWFMKNMMILGMHRITWSRRSSLHNPFIWLHLEGKVFIVVIRQAWLTKWKEDLVLVILVSLYQLSTSLQHFLFLFIASVSDVFCFKKTTLLLGTRCLSHINIFFSIDQVTNILKILSSTNLLTKFLKVIVFFSL